MTKRRGLTSVVGAVFAIIAIITAIGYVTYSMNLLEKFNQSVLVRTEESIDRSKEDFNVVKANVVNDKLNITVQNSASLPVHLTRLWVENMTVSDSVFKYDIDEVVSPGRTVTNIGQNVALNVDDADSYNIKLVTERGNSQQFTVSSVGTAPLNIQFYAFPSTIPSDFTTELVMIVTNNQSSTLTNLVPQISKWTGIPLPSTATCTPSMTASPPSVNTLAPGSTAVFKWDLKMIGKDGQICTYVASLQNGFPGNTASTTAAINAITATSSNWSTTWGILSINYTTLQWTQNNGTTWNTNWAVPKGPNCNSCTVWRVDMINNDPVRPFIFNGNSTLVAFGTSSGSNAAYQWYMIRNNYPGIHAYPTNDQILAANSTQKLYFGASSAGGTTGVYIDKAGQYAVSVLTFGYWNSVSSNNFFGQNIPYEGIIAN